jgi:chemotaxis protein MotB
MLPRRTSSSFSLRRSRPKDDDDQDSWLITYADLITQLMCFFVLLLMVSDPQTEKFESATKALASGFMPTMVETPYAELYKATDYWVNSEGIAVQAAVDYSNRGVTIDIAGDALYAPNSANPTPEAVSRIARLAPALKDLPWKRTQVVVEGHSDDTPTTGSAYASAWELSAARAGGVARLLEAGGVPGDRMQIRAFGETRPVVKNRDGQDHAIAENQAKNRRVIIRIERVE